MGWMIGLMMLSGILMILGLGLMFSSNVGERENKVGIVPAYLMGGGLVVALTTVVLVGFGV